MTTLIISPHFDDAPLSLGQSILDGVLGPRPTVVGVVFSRSSFVQWMRPTRRRWPLATGVRLTEELVNARRFGYRTRLGGIEEVALRDGTTVAAEFRRPDPVLDERVIERVAEVLGRWMQDATVAYAPLGVGSHRDHLIVAEAAQRLDDPRMRYYEDRPYASEYDEERISAEARRLDAALRPAGAVPITARKHELVWYPSQFSDFFVKACDRDLETGRSEVVWAHP